MAGRQIADWRTSSKTLPCSPSLEGGPLPPLEGRHPPVGWRAPHPKHPCLPHTSRPAWRRELSHINIYEPLMIISEPIVHVHVLWSQDMSWDHKTCLVITRFVWWQQYMILRFIWDSFRYHKKQITMIYFILSQYLSMYLYCQRISFVGRMNLVCSDFLIRDILSVNLRQLVSICINFLQYKQNSLFNTYLCSCSVFALNHGLSKGGLKSERTSVTNIFIY